MIYNASTDKWYQYFNADGPQWLILLGVYGFRALWATLGICFDFGIVYITVKSKSLRSICNILIAMESAFALILNIGYYVSFLVVLSGIKFIRYEYCFWYLIVPCLFGDVAQLLMVFTGVDRLCCVVFPVWYKMRRAKYYLTFVSVVLCCYATYDYIINYIDYLNSKDFILSCTVNEMGNGGMGTLMKMNGLTFSGTLMVLYSLCWFTVFRLNATSKNVNSNNRKLIKSLIFIIGLNLIGVFIKSIVNMIFQSFVVVNVFIKTAFSIAFSFLTITVYSANAPVLYTVSTEYRTRFLKHFPWLPQFVSNSVVSPFPNDTDDQSTTVPRQWLDNANDVNKTGVMSTKMKNKPVYRVASL
uniref:G-protein coupled receptors family 1 profile domain-containing protein n=1 Tax=Globodera rostochiensis TaxID=31243 RepID=A0A914I8N3_GLORO